MENILETAYTRNAIVHQCIKHGLSEAETLMWLEEGYHELEQQLIRKAEKEMPIYTLECKGPMAEICPCRRFPRRGLWKWKGFAHLYYSVKGWLASRTK